MKPNKVTQTIVLITNPGRVPSHLPTPNKTSTYLSLSRTNPDLKKTTSPLNEQTIGRREVEVSHRSLEGPTAEWRTGLPLTPRHTSPTSDPSRPFRPSVHRTRNPTKGVVECLDPTTLSVGVYDKLGRKTTLT